MNDQLVLKKLSELESFFKEFRAMIESTMFKPDLERDVGLTPGEWREVQQKAGYEGGVEPDLEGWIPWHGGACPVEKGTLVDVKYRNGQERLSNDAWCYTWNDKLHDFDIIAYRLAAPDVHAENKRLYAMDDAKIKNAWRVWLCKTPVDPHFHGLTKDPLWATENAYRRHPEADVMIEYFRERGENINAGDNWEWTWGTKVTWFKFTDCDNPVNFDLKSAEFRRKARTIMIGDIEVPEPMREAPAIGTKYYLVNSIDCEGFEEYDWANDSLDLLRLKYGLCQATRDGAIAQAKATINLYTGEQQ